MEDIRKYNPTKEEVENWPKEEIEEWRKANPKMSFSMMDFHVVRWFKKERAEREEAERRAKKERERALRKEEELAKMDKEERERALRKEEELAKMDKEERERILREKEEKAREAREAEEQREKMRKLLSEWEESGELSGFEIPTRSKRGPRITKSADNPHKVAEPNRGFLLAEKELTRPEEAVSQMKEMFPTLNTENWEQALRLGVWQAVAGCVGTSGGAFAESGIDLKRLVFFPWVKREALARILREQSREIVTDLQSENPHYGKLIEQGVFPKLEKLYKEKYNLGFKNYRAGCMSEDRFLQMRPKVAEWVSAREAEVEGDICFSGAILDMFQGHSVNSNRYEVENNYPNLVLGTSYVVMQMLLTQSQLKTKWEELHFDMAGDMYDYEGNSSFSSALFAFVLDGGFWFYFVRTAAASTPFGGVVLPSAT